MRTKEELAADADRLEVIKSLRDSMNLELVDLARMEILEWMEQWGDQDFETYPILYSARHHLVYRPLGLPGITIGQGRFVDALPWVIPIVVDFIMLASKSTRIIEDNQEYKVVIHDGVVELYLDQDGEAILIGGMTLEGDLR